MNCCDSLLDRTIWISFVALVCSTEQSEHDLLRQFARQKNRDMKCCGNSLDRTPGYDLLIQMVKRNRVCYDFHCFGDIIGSFVAIPEVILVISDVDLDNFLKFDKQLAKILSTNGFFEPPRLKQV